MHIEQIKEIRKQTIWSILFDDNTSPHDVTKVLDTIIDDQSSDSIFLLTRTSYTNYRWIINDPPHYIDMTLFPRGGLNPKLSLFFESQHQNASPSIASIIHRVKNMLISSGQ